MRGMLALAETTQACTIPPEVFEIAVGWDPQPEIDRLLLLCRDAGVTPLGALELGCGAGRLMRALRERGVGVAGVELSDEMTARARQHGLDVRTGDMARIALGRRFDLVYCSANTLRYLLREEDVAALWRNVHRHLSVGGLFIAYLEVGLRYFAEQVGRPQTWHVSRDDVTVSSTWKQESAPHAVTRCCSIEWSFDRNCPARSQRYVQRFRVRCDDASDLAAAALQAGMTLVGTYEIREPFLIPVSHCRAQGRILAVFRKP